MRKGVMGKVPDGFYTRAEVASMTGVSVSTLIRWRKSGRFMPERVDQFGTIRVGLYSQSQVDQLSTGELYRRGNAKESL